MNKINPRKALNPAYRKHKPIRREVNQFIEELKKCLVTVKKSDAANESEEHIKEPIKTFLKNTFYSKNLVNTKEKIDLAIYTGKDVSSDVGVIIEAKRPSNKTEFITTKDLNRKALQELLLYYLRERIVNGNNSIKHLVATNGYEWFLFKSEDFYTYFFKNKSLIKEYKEFIDDKKDSSKNDLFYQEIAKKYIKEVHNDLPFIHLDFTKTKLEDYKDRDLNTLYKLFSDVHILGNSFGNDSNELNKDFYEELLHIIGLEEVKDKGKKTIQRIGKEKRDYGSLLENTIFTIEDKDHLSKISRFKEDVAFNAGLALCLTWVNRILFLKLLESQLLSYHKDAKEYRFLNEEFIEGFDDLNDLFFSAIAKKKIDRHPKFKDKYEFIPYLNSSLFERNDLESETFEISALNNDEMELFGGTILKDLKGKKRKGKLKTLDYLFQFLNAFDFATDGTDGISDENESKALINASVLGLIFEKINGYKEGSFYTPSYITMYVCKETLRQSVVQKFCEVENEQIETFEDLKSYCHKYFKPEDTLRFNKHVNSIRICDPAVGSGHFLVSALNELISIKSDLGILIDAKGIPLSIDLHLEKDELYITDSRGYLYEYNPNDKESVRIQHTLFNEKRNIIENCLFGVDINPNSVKICRLRLWIELLKNAYYTKSGELQTLPNIDINIKCGNSLVSRFELDDNLSDAFKSGEVKYSFKDYKNAVQKYKDTNDKAIKSEVIEIIKEIKSNFKSTLDDKTVLDYQKAKGLYENERLKIDNLKKFGEKISKEDKQNLKELHEKALIEKAKKEEIVNNTVYQDAFEWRFEFPEILDEKGSFVGFDAIIGNPPWVSLMGKHSSIKDDKILDYYKRTYPENTYMPNLYEHFVKLAVKVVKDDGYNCFIVPDRLGSNESLAYLREFLLKETTIKEIIYRWDFPEIITDTVTYLLQKKSDENYTIDVKYKPENDTIQISSSQYLNGENFNFKSYVDLKTHNLITKLNMNKTLKEYALATSGFGGKSKLISEERKSDSQIKIIKGKSIGKYKIKEELYFDFIDENITGRTRDVEKLGAKPKLVLRKTGIPLICALEENGVYPEQSLYLIYNLKEQIDPKFLLALMNSKLFNWYYISELVTNIDSTPQLKNSDLYKFPVKSSDDDQKFKNLVEQVLKLKNQDINSDITEIERQLDNLVYELYNLNRKEIELVESSCR